MPDSKITALTSISTSTDPANDPLVIVDVSDTSMAATGTTKKVTLNQLLGASGTATLASATISGDLTVDTSTLKVDSANDRVGIKTVTPRSGFALDVLGNVALGNSTTTTSNRLKLDCAGTAGNVAVMSFAAAGTTKAFYGLSGGYLGDASTDALVATDAAGAAIRFYTSDTGVESGRFNSTGNLVLKGGTVGANGVGATFPATQVASSDSNCLDDYEEGTWTIGLTFGGGNTGITTSANTGRYTKVGRQVTVIGYLALTNKGSSTGSAVITGLPFTSPNSLEAFAAATLRVTAVSYTGTIQGIQLINSTKIELDNISDAGAVSSLTDSNFANSSSIMISCTYTV